MLNTAARPEPRFLPDPPDLSRALIRAAAAMVMREIRGPMDGSAEQILERMWPNDRGALTVLRAASSPMTTTSASALQPSTTAAFVSGLQLRSAAARLMGLGLQLDLTGIATILIPHAVSNAALGFVGEGSPAPVLQRVLANATLGPAKKIAGIATLTRELAESTPLNLEAVLGTLLAEASALALDGAVGNARVCARATPVDRLGEPNLT
jgi:HK97 family phage major capsid protein